MAETHPHYLASELHDWLTTQCILDPMDKGFCDGFWIRDLEAPETEYVSPGFWRLLGFEPSKMQPLAVERERLLLSDNDADDPFPSRREVRRFMRYRNLLGQPVTMLCRMSLLRYAGKPARMIGANLLVPETEDLVNGGHVKDLERRELSHRMNNIFAVVGVIARLTAQRETSLDGFMSAFQPRLTGLANLYAMGPVDTDGDHVALRRVLAGVVSAYCRTRWSLEGPSHVALPPELVTPFSLILHELAANAMKHGAWSEQAGHITISWRVEDSADDRWLTILWHEQADHLSAASPVDGSSGEGAGLVDELIDQLGGTVSRHATKGDLQINVRLRA